MHVCVTIENNMRRQKVCRFEFPTILQFFHNLKTTKHSTTTAIVAYFYLTMYLWLIKQLYNC